MEGQICTRGLKRLRAVALFMISVYFNIMILTTSISASIFLNISDSMHSRSRPPPSPAILTSAVKLQCIQVLVRAKRDVQFR